MMAWLMLLTFGLLWLLIAGRNAYDLWQARTQGQSTSLTLFIGGLFGAAAFIAVPYPDTVYWCWLPMVLDVGCLPALVLIWRKS